MIFPIFVESIDGQFAATLIGVSNLSVVGSTRAEAIDTLRAAIEQRIALGQLSTIEIEATGVADLAGKYKFDSTLPMICDEVYQLRNAEESG